MRVKGKGVAEGHAGGGDDDDGHGVNDGETCGKRGETPKWRHRHVALFAGRVGRILISALKCH